MAHYSNRYKKSYGLGYKPTVVLRKQLERTIIKDIALMNNKIKDLIIKRQEYLEYQKRRILYEQQVSLTIDPLEQTRTKLISDESNYKKGIIYLFRNRELKDDIRQKIVRIDSQIKQYYDDLEKRFKVKNSPYCGYELKANEIDRRIDYDINRQINHYQKAIKTYQSELELKQNKNQHLENIKGLAAQAINKTRQRANQIKSNMIINDFCPYCGERIDEVHVDHIYPVAKGGLSSTKNMVRVCALCNMKKKDLTLSQFIKKYKFDRDFVEGNLDLLNKSY